MQRHGWMRHRSATHQPRGESVTHTRDAFHNSHNRGCLFLARLRLRLVVFRFQNLPTPTARIARERSAYRGDGAT